MTNKYRVLKQQEFTLNDYKIVPIRFEDRFKIMQWRNEQLYHLRQKELLTKEKQDIYFKEVIAKSFDEIKPSQILFSFLRKEKCIGYGGLVHIDWKNKNAEVSFVMKTSLEENFFIKIWSIFLILLKKVAFIKLDLHKIYTFSYEIRPKLYDSLLENGLLLEGRLKDHSIVESKFFDVLYHSCINPIHNLNLRNLKKIDSQLLFNWRNDSEVRKNSFNTELIPLESHEKWFNEKISNINTKIYIFETKHGHPVGQVRLDYINEKWLIDYSIDKFFRGLGLGKNILMQTINLFEGRTFVAKVIKHNYASIKIFKDLTFKMESETENHKIFELIK
jgi:RimJ/RimL family protein N-acetyltransferase